MATTYTPLLELPKHDTTDPFDITKINDMADLVDTGMAKAYRGKAAHNLLDNSDFRAGWRVAQAGLNGTHGSVKYVCDRWISLDEDATFADGYITPGSPIDQRLDPAVIDMAATYTVAICLSDGTVRAASGNFTNGFGSYDLGVYCPSSTTQPYVRLNTGFNIRWAALYEGIYTADTLPEYQPKGYAAELMECMRYYIKILTQPVNGWCYNWGRVTMFVPTPVKMRNANPTATLSATSPNFYIGSTSHIASLASCSAVNNGVNVIFNHSSAVSGQCVMPEFSAEISADL